MFGLDKIGDIISDLLKKMWDWLIGPFKDLHTLHSLVFGEGGTDKYIFNTFHENEILNVYQPGFNTLLSLAAIGVLIGVIVAGTRISSSGFNPAKRVALIEFLKDLAIVGILLANLDTIYQLVFFLNQGLVHVFSGANDTLSDFSTRLDSQGAVSGILGWIVMQLVLLGLSIWANFYYMMRKVTLLLFMIMGPLMVAFWMIPQLKGLTAAWFKEFCGAVLVQSVHAFTFWIVMAISINETHFISGVILYVIFIPISEGLKSLVGLGGGMTGAFSKAGAAFGLSSLAGMYGAAKGALGDKSFGGALREAYQGVRNGKHRNGEGGDNTGNVIGANAGTDIGTTSKAEKMLRAGEITSKAGKAVFGMAGSIAGGPMGPVGAMSMGAVGFAGGGAVGGLAGRLGASTALGAANRFKKGLEGAKRGANDFSKLDEQTSLDDLAKHMADEETSGWISSNKKSLMNDLKERFPDATPKQLDKLFQGSVEKKRQDFKANALNTLGSLEKSNGKLGNAAELAEKTANELTNSWANSNKANAFREMKQANPNMTEEEMDNQWSNLVNGKKQQYLKLANGTASQMSNGIDLQHSSINKAQFGDRLKNDLLEHEKGQLRLKNPKLSSSDIDVEFNKSKGSQNVKAAIDNGLNSIKGQKLFANGHLNKDHFASMMATNMTKSDQDKYVQQLVSSGVPEGQAKSQWKNHGSQQAYASNYKNVKDNIQSFAPGKAILPNSFGGKAIKGISMAGGAAVGFAKGASGINEVKDFLVDTKVGKLAINTTTGFLAGRALHKTGIKEQAQVAMSGASVVNTGAKNAAGTFISGVKGGASAFGNTWNEKHIPQNLIGRQRGLTQGVAYGSGVIFGVNGYQKAARVTSKINPYNHSVNNNVQEVSEIAQMASEDSIKLVTTGNQSYIQAMDKMGKTKIVSRFGAGDSSLKNGQVIYQDLSIENGALIHSPTGAYMQDSGGGKIRLNRQINIDPNRLVANRGKNIQSVDIQPINQKVDDGQFYMGDVSKQFSNVRVITERNRSYAVAKDVNGIEQRISPYGQGDTRLQDGEVVYTDGHISNRRIIKERVYKVNPNTGEQIEFHSSLDPNILIPTQPNNRLNRRQEMESLRYKQGV